MKGVSPVLESVLLAGAVITFLMFIAGAFNDLVDIITDDKIRNSLEIDANKVAYAIIFAYTHGTQEGTTNLKLGLADLPEEIWVDGGVRAKSGNRRVLVSLHGLENEMNVSGRIVNTRGFTPYVKYQDGVIYLGVE
ncbi:MAG TPA: hypothetical protein ENN60_00275 [archaeon]|nr:hypothetical protein [archaeon]